MKTYTNIYTKLCSYENLLSAFKKARKGKTNKNYVIEFERNLDINIKILQFELINRLYKPKRLKLFIIRDPKTRKICKSVFRDRIVHHAIVNILEPIYEKIFIYDSYASRKGKGQHKALQRFDYFKRKVSNNGKKLNGINDNNYVCGYVLKIDIAHYFDTVDRDVLISIIKEKINDEGLILLIQKILKIYQNKTENKGMPLGNYTSQFFANVYLNKLDYFIKHELKAKCYIRYVDDLVILHNKREVLEKYKERIINYLKNLKLEIHPTKSRIISLHRGIPFLGFRIFYYYRLLKKGSIQQMERNLEEWRKLYDEGLIDYERLIARLEGWLAHSNYGDGYNLRKEIVKNFNRKFNKPLSSSLF